MKKLIALLCVLAMAFGLAACSSSNSKPAEDAEPDTSSETTAEAVGTVNTKDVINVGFVQLVDMADAQQMHDSFLKTIDDAGLSDKIVVDFQSASGDTGTMSTIIQGFVDKEYDVVVPMLTPPTQAAVSICGGETPIIFMSVVDPVYSKIMPDLNTVDPAILATGTSNTIPADLIIETANALTPIEEGKKIVIMYNTSQNNAECTMNAAKAYCEEKGFPYEVVGYADVTDAVTQAQSINADETAYVYVTLDSIIASNFNQLGQALTEAGIPVYGAADAMTTGGAFCSYGVDYGTVGEMTAEMVIEWYNGTPLESMPCRQYSDFTLVINEDVMNALGITLPDSYAEAATYVTTH
ncbi:MAG: ABC transporter substrate-binding protein [Clostridia bacterium]|nr:ABC transporter substrate-binding protein [Clostridia bacterium]